MGVKTLYNCLPLLTALLFSSGMILASQTAFADIQSTSTSSGLFSSSSDKTFELRTAPVAFIAKWYTIDAALVLTDHFSTGPSAIFYQGDEDTNMITPSHSGQAVGWNASYYFKPLTRNGTYLSTHAYYDEFKNYPHGSPTGNFDNFKGFKTNVAFGYRTHFSVLAVMMGIGAEYRDYDVKRGRHTEPTSNDREYGNRSGVIPYAEFKIGVEI